MPKTKEELKMEKRLGRAVTKEEAINAEKDPAVRIELLQDEVEELKERVESLEKGKNVV